MQLQPYLYFNGDCETAFRFYERSCATLCLSWSGTAANCTIR
jgi:uncharacterized glyoxalase superfamily protein PhnB